MNLVSKVGRVLAVLLLGWWQPSVAKAADDKAADAGLLIYSVGNIAIPMNFTFSYRRIASPSGQRTQDNRGSIKCKCVGFFSARVKTDYDGPEFGNVVVRSLPVGQYEINDFGFGGSTGAASVSWSSSNKFSLPFRIEPGRATYIGNFARGVTRGSYDPRFGAAGFFVISDKALRDLAIARTRQPQLPPVTVQVADVAKLQHPMILAEAPR